MIVPLIQDMALAATADDPSLQPLIVHLQTLPITCQQLLIECSHPQVGLTRNTRVLMSR